LTTANPFLNRSTATILPFTGVSSAAGAGALNRNTVRMTATARVVRMGGPFVSGRGVRVNRDREGAGVSLHPLPHGRGSPGNAGRTGITGDRHDKRRAPHA